VQVQWGDYGGCPDGFDLSGYEISVTSGVPDDSSTPVGTTTVKVTTGTAGASGTTSFTYVAICGTGSNSIQSSPSPALQLPYS
jgi:eukaryotic-like serine/threonine-protein kinase